MWTYPYIRPWTVAPFLISLVLIPPLLVLLRMTRKLMLRHEAATICVWCIVGFLAQLLIRSLYPFAIGTIIESPGATSFYTATQQYTAVDLFSHFSRLAGSLPLHARANMPGKILFFFLLEMLTSSTTLIGYLIIVVSNLGGPLVYCLAKQLFADRLSALYAMILYLFLPMKLYFFPLLNTVTPVLVLLSLLLFVQYLSTKQSWYLLALGVSLYFLMLFEPLPFVTGLIFLALLARHAREGSLHKTDFLRIVAYVPA